MSIRRHWPLVLVGLMAFAFLVYQIPAVKARVEWRLDAAIVYLRNWLAPAGELPPPQVENSSAPLATAGGIANPTPAPTPIAQVTPTALPGAVQLVAPAHEFQGANNCGPATLAMYLRYYGWEGDQYDISDEVKPVNADRNVNPDELIYYASNWAGWAKTAFRVGGSIELIKELLAAGIPVMIEEGEIILNQGPNDDNWAAHYILITGYDDGSGSFTYQDSFRGPDQAKTYDEVDEYWQQFNRIYILAYLPDQEETVKAILGADWDEDTNRQNALAMAQAETVADPQNAYAWFNVGMNQVYFEEYGAAAASFDQARAIGLPMRMLRYQFGPFFADYHTNRLDDLEQLVDYALQVTPNSEDVMLWKGWLLYKRGDINGAAEQFRLAREANPNSIYVEQALNFLGATP
ncbi:MAG: C39 family peptidase [Anaerolineales bacterium]